VVTLAWNVRNQVFGIGFVQGMPNTNPWMQTLSP
jgi:hypothetical protein